MAPNPLSVPRRRSRLLFASPLALALLLSPSHAPRARGAYEPEQVHLGFTGEFGNSVTVEWVTKAVPPEPPGSWVQYGDSPSELSGRARSSIVECGPTHPQYPNWVGILHEALLTELLPGQLYYYRVGSQEEWSTVRNFRSAPAPAPAPAPPA
eukprot:SAG11_NODE_15935_length_562_cov_0.742981_1_plen_153_part_00